MLSHFCREVVVNAIPAVQRADTAGELAVLSAMEKRLAGLGIFRFKVQGNFSHRSASVLPALGYVTSERFEFYLRLSDNLDLNWSSIRKERRHKIRKAMNSGVTVVAEADQHGVRKLLDLHGESLQKKGIEVRTCEEQIGYICQHLLQTERACLLVAYRNAIPVGALLYGSFGNQACTLLSGSSSEGKQHAAMALIHWTMIESLTARRVNLVSMGGVTLQRGEDPATNGLYNFKKEIGAEPVSQPSGVKTLAGIGQMLSGLRDCYKRIRAATM
jgi:lipid II:glycine glycyltransferase (peptidoglycan interpeptide bridge formation enzyme)